MFLNSFILSWTDDRTKVLLHCCLRREESLVFVGSEINLYYYIFFNYETFSSLSVLDFRQGDRYLYDHLDMNGFSEEQLLNVTFEACDAAGRGRLSSLLKLTGRCSRQNSENFTLINRRSSCLDCGAVFTGHDRPQWCTGQTDCPEAHAGPRGPRSACRPKRVSHHHEEVDCSVQPGLVRHGYTWKMHVFLHNECVHFITFPSKP